MTARYATPGDMSAALLDGSYQPARRSETAVGRAQPDIVELLPGVILPEVADLVLPRLSVPLLAGGFIRDAAAVRAALAAGAMAVTTSERALWN